MCITVLGPGLDSGRTHGGARVMRTGAGGVFVDVAPGGRGLQACRGMEAMEAAEDMSPAMHATEPSVTSPPIAQSTTLHPIHLGSNRECGGVLV
jgi:hypothetical protein